MSLPAAPRVLVISQYGQKATGGAERYVHEVCRRLTVQHGFTVHAAATDLGPGTPALPGLSPARYPLWSAGFNPAWSGELRRLITAFGPDVLYVHHTVPGVTDVALRVARRLRLNAEVMYHSDVTGADLPRRLVGAAYQALIGNGSLAGARRLHAPSEAYLQASVALRASRLPTLLAPPGVDAEMSGALGSVGPARTHAPYLLFVGKADVPSKGFPVLLEAWQHLRRRWPKLELAVIGSGQAHLEQAEGLRLLGQVSSRAELADWYASALVTVLPSLSTAESFGMVLAEALVAGSPVVASRVGGLPALVDEGRTGYLAEPGDASSLSATLDQALTHNARLRTQIRVQRSRLLNRFSWDATAQVVANALAEGLEVRRTSSPGSLPKPDILLPDESVKAELRPAKRGGVSVLGALAGRRR
jgi:glycosyltransferase involved in cell wall biosynthesis